MVVTIFSSIFVLSAGGLAWLTVRKIPALLALPETEQSKAGFWPKRQKMFLPEPYSKQEFKVQKASLNISSLGQKERIENQDSYWQQVAEEDV